MASKTIVVGGAIAVDGLKESMAGLGRAKKELRRDAVRVSRQVTKPVLARARANWQAQPITTSKANRAVTAAVSTTGAGIKLRVSVVPTAAAVEYGAHIHFVFGRPQPATSMNRRVFKPWRGNQFTVAPGTSTGYVVQDAIRDTLPMVEREWADAVIAKIDEWVERG